MIQLLPDFDPDWVGGMVVIWQLLENESVEVGIELRPMTSPEDGLMAVSLSGV